MGFRNLALGLCIAGATLGAPTVATSAAEAATFTSLTIFGDSLVDAGNVYIATGGAIPPSSAGYFQGRFTNGYVYPDLLSFELFGSPTVPYLAGGTNFAVGGAQAVTNLDPSPDLQQQLMIFGASGQPIDPTGLYVLNFGGNDVRAALAPGVPTGYASDEAFLLAAASSYAAGVQALVSLGVHNLLVTGFPVPVEYSALAEGFLTTQLAALSLGPDTNLYYFSYLDFYERLIADPTAYGLPSTLDIVTTCQQAQALPDCTGYLYFDNIHPTAAIHEAAYMDIRQQLGIAVAVPEPATWAMMLLGFAAVGWSMRRAARDLKLAQTA